jgi:hypothetical protein
MLSAAKHLLFLVENKQKQIPRFALCRNSFSNSWSWNELHIELSGLFL